MTTETENDPHFEALLNHLWRSRGFDFSGYKRTSLMRRVRKRMADTGIEDFVDYTDYLEVHPDEFAHLFDTILINVTAFFRDPQAWEYVQEQIIPRIIESKKDEEYIRIWSAACASGEEAYTLAILFAEALGFKKFKDRVKIYATDADEDSLSTARQAKYNARSIENIPENLREKYFSKDGDLFVFRPELRKSIIFGRHDLVQDPPISKVDLLVCRNTLMYFNSETQNKIVSRFNFALNESGFLFLGKAEMLLTHMDSFAQSDLKQRVFVKTKKDFSIERLLPMQPPHFEVLADDSKNAQLTEASMDSSLVSQLLIDHTGTLIVANKNARALFNLKPQDIGKALQDLEISYRPVELRSLIEQAYSDHQPVKIPKIERILPNRKIQYLEVEVTPLFIKDGHALGVTVSFVDVTTFHNLRLELEASNQELETANEELQSAHEELETTNEELQSTNEELETTNEELQSTNEELETMNEELRSTNEELEAMNAELKTISNDLNESNFFLHSILTSMNSVVIAIDHNFDIIAWNFKAQDIWGITEKEAVGCSLWELDTGLPVASLKQPLLDFISGKNDHCVTSLDGTSRRGKAVSVTVKMSRLKKLDGKKDGYLLIMDDQPNG